MTKLPAALDSDPVVEAIFEIRFTSALKSVDSLLLGALFPAFRDHFPRVAALPMSQIPPILRANQPKLARQPTQSLEGKGKRILIGDSLIALAHLAPYPGWQQFQPLIMRLAEALKGTNIINRVERFSLKYMNIVKHGSDEYDLQQLKIRCELDGFSLRGPGFSLRSEIDQDQCVAVVEIQSGVTMTVKSQEGTKSYNGVRLSVDTIWQAGFKDFWSELPQMLTVTHDTAKRVFFGLLEDKTVEKMGPKWE